MRAREQATLLSISQTLASALELQPGLILDQLEGIVEFTRAGLFVFKDSVLEAQVVRGDAWQEQEAAFKMVLETPEERSALYNDRLPTRIGDIWSDESAARSLRTLLGEQAEQLLQGLHSWMWVPMAAQGHFIGLIGLAHAEWNHFNEHHSVLALTVSNQAAITLINADLYKQARSLATLQERQRLARTLHDAVNQSLFSAGLIAEVLPRLWDQDPDEGKRSLKDLRRLVRGAQADLRLLLAELLPATLTDADLGDLLQLLGNAISGRSNLPITVTVIGKGMLPADVQVAMYRLCQEGMNNIVRHARASQVELHLEYSAGEALLRLKDDGRGFDPEATIPGHYGLSMMRERAADIGANLVINSQPGQGTEMIIRWVERPKPKANER